MNRVDYDTNHDGYVNRSEYGGQRTRLLGEAEVVEADLYKINSYNLG